MHRIILSVSKTKEITRSHFGAKGQAWEVLYQERGFGTNMLSVLSTSLWA